MKNPSERIQEIADRIAELYSKQAGTQPFLLTPELTAQINISAIIEFLVEEFSSKEDKPTIAANSTWTYKMGWNECLKSMSSEIEQLWKYSEWSKLDSDQASMVYKTLRDIIEKSRK